jgi:hypothetical protein
MKRTRKTIDRANEEGSRMGTFNYTFSDEGSWLTPAQTPGGTKAGAAAELRGRGLTVIAASLEGAPTSHVCGVVQPGRERGWMQTLDTDIVELIKRRYFNGQ